MGTTYKRAAEATAKLVSEMLAKHHSELAELGVGVDVLMASNRRGSALKCHGYEAAATIALTSPKHLALGLGDALMCIDAAEWERLDAKARAALVDHELEHVALVTDDEGNTIRDREGRPRLELRKHDWQLGGFATVVTRHREHAPEVRAARAVCDSKTGQYAWDWQPALKVVAG